MKKLSVILGTTLPIVSVGIILPPCIFAIRDKNQTVSADKQTIDDINEFLEENKPNIKTMYQLVSYLKLTTGTDLEKLEAQKKDQIVWDEEANVVFTLNSNNKISYAPSTYKLNSNKHKIWKMVSYGSSNGKIESFNKDSEYGQYLRKISVNSNDLTKISFSCPLDVGYNTGFELTYKNSATITGENPAVTINTNACKLIIDGTTSNIDHYGQANTLSINGFSDTHKYNEYGTVDGNAVLTTKVGFVAQPGSYTNTVYVNDSNASVKIVKENDEVGLVGTVTTSKDDINPEGKTDYIGDVTEEEKPDFPGKQPEPTTRYAGGLGTVKSPYSIALPDHLVHASEDVSGDSATALTVETALHFVLNADIDMSDKTFNPIGTKDKPFFGTFDGQGYTISNLTVTPNAAYGEYRHTGLFGYTNGATNANYTSHTDIWDDTNNELITDNIDESNYTTIIKNIDIENITVDNTSYKNTGGIVGSTNNTYISNCQVKTGTITGWKATGGIAGGLNNSICTDCSVGDSTTGANKLEIKTSDGGYNAGGIVGAPSYGGISGGYEAITRCITCSNTLISCTGTTGTGGYFGGIVGMAQNSSCFVVSECTNYANINIASGTSSGIAGIVAQTGNCYAIDKCENHGNITLDENNAMSTQIGGIAAYGEALILECRNYGNIKGKINTSVTDPVPGMAGIFAGTSSMSHSHSLEIINCFNEGELDSYETVTEYDICSSVSQTIFKDQAFASVTQINSRLESAPQGTAQFINCTVDYIDTKLNVPTTITSIVSDNKICDEINLGTNKNVYVKIPDANITLSGETDARLVSEGDNVNVTVQAGARVANVIVGGEGSTVTNNGTITGRMGIDGGCVSGVNNQGAKCSNVTFGYTGSLVGTGSKVFKNYGTVCCNATNANQHVLFSFGTSTCTIEIENHGTIQYVKPDGFEKTLGYLCCLYNQPNPYVPISMKFYNGSMFKTNASSIYFFAAGSTHQYALKYQEGAKVMLGDTEKSFTDFSSQYITVEEF